MAALIGISIAGGLLLAGSAFEPKSTTLPTQVGRGWTCSPGPGPRCTLAAGGNRSLLDPVSTWCNATNSYSHGYLTGTTWDCHPSPMELDFNETGDTALSGTFSVDGPAQLWILPAVDGCELVSDLESQYAQVLWSCAPPAGPAPTYTWWNQTLPIATEVNLSSLTFDFGASPGVLPPVDWSLIVADTGTTAETLQVGTPITIAPT